MLALVGTGYLHANANWFVYCVFFAIQFLLASGFLQYLHVYGVQKAQIYLGGWSVLIIYLIFWVLFFCCLLPLQLSVMSRTKFPPPPSPCRFVDRLLGMEWSLSPCLPTVCGYVDVV
jgi:hypothetical protein